MYILYTYVCICMQTHVGVCVGVCVILWVAFADYNSAFNIKKGSNKHPIVSGTVLDRILCTGNISVTRLWSIMQIIIFDYKTNTYNNRVASNWRFYSQFEKYEDRIHKYNTYILMCEVNILKQLKKLVFLTVLILAFYFWLISSARDIMYQRYWK